jgi:hypothetical protein
VNSIERQKRRRWLADRESRLANQPTPDEADRALREHIAMQLVGYRIVATDVSDAKLVEYMGYMKPPGPKKWGSRRAREKYERKAQEKARQIDASLASEQVRLSTWQRYARAIGAKIAVPPMQQITPPRQSVLALQRTLLSRHRRWQRQRFRPRLVL